MDLYEILHRRQGLDLIQRAGCKPSAGSVNLDDMDKESLKGFAQFVLQSNEELKHDKEMLQRTVEGLSSQLKQANESLSNIERMLHSAQEKNAKDSLLIDELRGIVKTLEKQLDSANTYKKYKEKYEELRCEMFGSKS